MLRLHLFSLPIALLAAAVCASGAPASLGSTPETAFDIAAEPSGSAASDQGVATILAPLAAQPASAKLSPQLRAVAAGPSFAGRYRLAVISTAPIDVRRYATRWHAFRWPGGEHVTLLVAHGGDLLRIAALPGVVWVASADLRLEPQPLPSLHTAGGISWTPPLDRPSRWSAPLAFPMASDGRPSVELAKMDSWGRGAGASVAAARRDEGASTLGWYDARNGHRAQEAWEMGFRGTGVRVAIVDTGVDFGHQDLQEAWAVLPEGHPYAGWPQVYDPTATYAFVAQRKLGSDPELLRRGQVSLVEPYQQAATRPANDDPTVAHACFRPLLRQPDGSTQLATECADYRLPTSKSGQVRYGHHPDVFLARIPPPKSNAEIFRVASGTWQLAATLPEERLNPTATELADGRILVAGGQSRSGELLRAAYLYDPALGAWLPAGETMTGHRSALAVRLGNGQVLLIGDEGCELYDPLANTWRATASLAAIHATDATATLLADGRVLVAGGMTAERLPSPLVEIYDPATERWSQATNVRTARLRHGATLLADGRLLVVGGIGQEPLASAEIYDPATNRWTEGPSLASARAVPLVARLPDGSVLVTGGHDASGTALLTSELLPAAGTPTSWLAVGDMATGHLLGSLTPLADGRVLVSGGLTGTPLAPHPQAEIFDPATRSWQATGAMLGARAYHASARLPDGDVLVVGGSRADSSQEEEATEFAGVLLLDPAVAGRYDTVYVDLDKDHDFTDEKPVTKSSPLTIHDLNGDGITDLSGGLLYYLADGRLPIPGAYLWGVDDEIPPAGSLIGLYVDNGIHGTLCASNVASRGRLGAPPWAPSYRDLEGGTPATINPGMAPEAQIVAVGDAYSGFLAMATAWRYIVFGHDPERSDDDIQIASNSYGFSNVDHDGWEAEGRLLDHYLRRYAPQLSWVKSTGNGAPGYGTVTAPAPVQAIMVGASTQYGAASSSSITDTTQITFGDVVAFSNRGPMASGRGGPDIVANGSNGWGALPLSVLPAFSRVGLTVPMGGWANEPWSGTSRSGPVVAGGLAVAYQAFRETHERWPTAEEARSILMAGARFAGYDPFTGGAGVLDIADSARIASARHGIYAIPASWTAGGYGGKKAPAFARVLHAGESDQERIQIHNPMASPIDVTVRVQRLVEIGAYDVSLNTKLANESDYSSVVPNYLVPIEKAKIPADTELMVIHAILPLEQADVDGDQAPELENSFQLKVLRHTDYNRNLRLWRDRNLNGAVNFELDELGNINWQTAEIDRYEYEIVNEDAAETNSWAISVHHPLERWSSGLYIGVWHGPMECQNPEDPATCTGRTPLVPDTRIQFRLYFYRFADWPWLRARLATTRLTAKGATPLDLLLTVPPGTAPGAYDGAVFIDYDRAPDDQRLPTGGGFEMPQRRLTIPVNVNVAARYDGQGSLTFGGPEARVVRTPYDNGALWGVQDRLWRLETGDWRFFFFDAERPAAGTFWLVRTRWQDRAPGMADVDTSLWGPAGDRFSWPQHPENRDQDWSDPAWYGPYALERLAQSVRAYRGGGTWARQTSGGEDEDWLAAPARGGLYEVMLHNVLSSGAIHELPFETTVSSLRVEPDEVVFFGQGCRTVRITSQIELPALTVDAAGLSHPIRWLGLRIDSEAIVTRTLAIPAPAARFDVRLVSQPQTELYLILARDADADNEMDDEEVMAVGMDAGNVQFISLPGIQPAGSYFIVVVPAEVPQEGCEFDLAVDVAYGDQLTLQGAPDRLAAGTTAELTLCVRGDQDAAGPLLGVLGIGSGSSHGVLRVPVSWYATPPHQLALPRLSVSSRP